MSHGRDVWDYRWLQAPEQDVAAAMARLRQQRRPAWVPTRRGMLLHVNHCLLLWYIGIAWMTLGVRIDTVQENRIVAVDLRDIVVVTAIFVLWLGLSVWLHRWSRRPPSPRARLREWRQQLTALANGFEPQPVQGKPFAALLTAGDCRSVFAQRFVAPGLEFGNLERRGNGGAAWRYIAARLAAPVPHVVLESTVAGAVGALPVRIEREQRLSLEGDFDRYFRASVPAGYEQDALFVLTPEVMLALVDHAGTLSVELVDDRVLFFAPAQADFTQAAAWHEVAEVVRRVLPALAARARRYRDEHIPEQRFSPTIAAIEAAIERPGEPWVEPPRRIDEAGRRLDLRDRRTGGRARVAAVAWVAALVFLYPVPGIFAFAGFMSVVDGR